MTFATISAAISSLLRQIYFSAFFITQNDMIMNKIFYTIVVSGFILANATAQTAMFASNTSSNMATDGKQMSYMEAVTAAPNEALDINTPEAFVTVLDAYGKKVHNAIVMDGKFTLPYELIGMVFTIDIATESTHNAMEISVREPMEFATMR